VAPRLNRPAASLLGRLKTRLPVILALLALAVALGAGSASGADHFRAYASCSSKGKHADDFCFAGDHPVGVLRAIGQGHVTYKLCERRAGSKKHCYDRHTQRAGKRSRTRFDVDGAGTYKLAWFADGRAVDRDKLVVRDRAVFSVGDSLGEGTQPYLPGALPGWNVSQSVAVSRFLADGVSIVRSRGGLPGAVVFALGTNDDPHNVSSFSGAIQSVLEVAGKTRCVVVPNIVRPPVGGASYAGFNNALAALARHHDNLRVVDWAGLVAANRGWLAGDGVHVNATGYMARARAIAQQVESC
jgi:lysophospholipase L1-like esterase